MKRAVIFAYHQVGVRCLEVLLAHGVEIPLVFTHEDDPQEEQWFPSFPERAKRYGLTVVTPDSPNTPEWYEAIERIQPDFIFSFYYRHLISQTILDLVPEHAFNMHGSLLPHYRGRVPVNWAVLHGETETGATLHVMTAKPDQGECIDQMAMPILPNDTAFDVFQKVCVAAECVLHRTLPLIIAGTERRTPQDASQASYFGRRTREDGRILWSQTAAQIHNLIRAVASPYPGAFFEWQGNDLYVDASLIVPLDGVPKAIKQVFIEPSAVMCIQEEWWARGGDGAYLRLLDVRSK